MTRSFSDDGTKPYKNLPQSVDLSAELPHPGDQGEQNSCTGWAVAYAVKSFQEHRELGWAFNEKHLFSPTFLYNQLNHGEDRGAVLDDVIKLLIYEGAVPLSLMPYHDDDYTTQPDEEIKEVAQGFRSLSHRRINEQDVNQLKSFLAAGEPIVLSVYMYENFSRRNMAKSGNIYSEAVGDMVGGHAIVTVGYNDDKHAIKVLNSWGKRWGENGYGWIDYDFVPEVVREAHVIYDRPTPRETLRLLDEPIPEKSPTEDVKKISEEEKPPIQKIKKKVVAVPLQPLPPKPKPVAEPKPVPKPVTEPAPAPEPKIEPEPQIAPMPKPAISSNIKDPILIVPNDAAIQTGTLWLHIGSPLEKARQFFGFDSVERFKNFNPMTDAVKVDGDFLFPDKIGRIHFFPNSSTPIATNQGITFGSSKEDVHRVYQTPDHSDNDFNSETYFFHSATKDWGGVPVTEHLALTFYYDDNAKVNSFDIANVFKKSIEGTGFVSMNKGEETNADITFTAPSQFTDVKKSVWEGIGVGYFLRADDAGEFLTIKVFSMKQPATETSLKERMKADLIGTPLPETLPTENFAGLEWKLVRQPTQIRHYAYKDSKIYQIQIIFEESKGQPDWIKNFLQTVVIK